MRKALTILFRLLLIIVIIEAGLRLSGYIHLLPQHINNKILPVENHEYRILVLGDSMTYGDGPSWAFNLESELNRNSMGTNFKVIIEARPGATSSTILSEIGENLDKYKPDMVITMMGVNDPALGASMSEIKISNITIKFQKFRTYKLGSYLFSPFTNRIGEINFIYVDSLIRQKMIDSEQYQTTGFPHGEQDQGISKNATIDAMMDKLEEFIGKNPTNETAYAELAKLYVNMHDPQEDTDRVLLGSYEPDVQLTWYYLRRNRPEDAERWFNIIASLNKGRLSLIFTHLGEMYEREYMNQEAQKYYEKAAEITNDYYNPAARLNYQKIYEMLNKNKIKFIAVQYPTLSLDKLKIFFKEDDNIIFVSNEENFKKELESASYGEIFRDHDHATFGHLTGRGANLLAENVANKIANELGITNDKVISG